MKNVFIFLAGAGVGAGATWYFVKKHYEKKADEEIADVVNRFKVYKDALQEESESGETKYNRPNPSYNREENGKSDDDTVYGNSEEELSNGVIDDIPNEKEGTAPYVISEEEFGENEDYDQKTLFWYYRDNILATDEDLEVEDKFTTIGNALEEFGKDRYLERIFVINEQDETYYEILLSEKHFYEVTGGDTE